MSVKGTDAVLLVEVNVSVDELVMESASVAFAVTVNEIRASESERVVNESVICSVRNGFSMSCNEVVGKGRAGLSDIQ